MFGLGRKKREAELRKKINMHIPNLTKGDKNFIKTFKTSPHIILSDAAITGNVAVIFELMCNGTDVAKQAETIMEIAIEVGDTSNDVLKLMLQTGASEQIFNAKFLKKAIQRKNDIAIDLLLEHRSKIDFLCVFEAYRQKNIELADKLVKKLLDISAITCIKDVYLYAIEKNEPDMVKEIEEKYFDIFSFSVSEMTEALSEAGREVLDIINLKSLNYVKSNELVQNYIENDKIEELFSFADRYEYSLDLDVMLSYAVQHKKHQIVSMLKKRGAKINAQTIILDMLKSRKDWHKKGETKGEFERRKRLFEYVDDLTEYDSRLLVYMIRNNKAKTVEYLLKHEKNWDSNAIKDGILFCAENGYYNVLEAIMLNSQSWDNTDYNIAVDNAVTPNMLKRVEKIRDKVLGSGWYVDDNCTVRKEQQLKEVSSCRMNMSLTTIFNFKSYEVTKIVRFSNKDKVEDVSYKNFVDYQNDSEIMEAYKRLCKFSKEPVPFNGITAKITTPPKKRIIRQYNIKK